MLNIIYVNALFLRDAFVVFIEELYYACYFLSNFIRFYSIFLHEKLDDIFSVLWNLIFFCPDLSLCFIANFYCAKISFHPFYIYFSSIL